MDEHDLHGRALLVVVRRDEPDEIEPDREHERSRDGEPRQDARRER